MSNSPFKLKCRNTTTFSGYSHYLGRTYRTKVAAGGKMSPHEEVGGVGSLDVDACRVPSGPASLRKAVQMWCSRKNATVC